MAKSFKFTGSEFLTGTFMKMSGSLWSHGPGPFQQQTESKNDACYQLFKSPLYPQRVKEQLFEMYGQTLCHSLRL